MLDIKEIKVSCEYGVYRLLVSFTTTDCAEDISNYRFDIYRGYSSDGPFDILATDVSDMEYVDERVNLLDTQNHYFYKVMVINRESGESKLSDKMGYIENHRPDNYASAIAEIEAIYLQNVINNDTVYLARRMTCGTRCTCYDDIRNSSSPDCPYCFGTRFVGGYFPAKAIKVNYSTALTISETMEPRSITENSNPIQFWMPALPTVHTNDLILGQNGHRYMVNGVSLTYKNHCILRQIVSAQWLPPSDIRYNVPMGGDVFHESRI